MKYLFILFFPALLLFTVGPILIEYLPKDTTISDFKTREVDLNQPTPKIEISEINSHSNRQSVELSLTNFNFDDMGNSEDGNISIFINDVFVSNYNYELISIHNDYLQAGRNEIIMALWQNDRLLSYDGELITARFYIDVNDNETTLISAPIKYIIETESINELNDPLMLSISSIQLVACEDQTQSIIQKAKAGHLEIEAEYSRTKNNYLIDLNTDSTIELENRIMRKPKYCQFHIVAGPTFEKTINLAGGELKEGSTFYNLGEAIEDTSYTYGKIFDLDEPIEVTDEEISFIIKVNAGEVDLNQDSEEILKSLINNITYQIK